MFNNQVWKEFKAKGVRMMCRGILLAFALFGGLSVSSVLVPFQPASLEAAGGINHSVIGLGTGTTAIQLTASPASFIGIKVGTATIGGFVKCWNVAAVTSLNDTSEANLLDMVYFSSNGAIAYPVANFQQFENGANAAGNASNGIACKKSVAGDIVIVKWSN